MLRSIDTFRPLSIIVEYHVASEDGIYYLIHFRLWVIHGFGLTHLRRSVLRGFVDTLPSLMWSESRIMTKKNFRSAASFTSAPPLATLVVVMTTSLSWMSAHVTWIAWLWRNNIRMVRRTSTLSELDIKRTSGAQIFPQSGQAHERLNYHAFKTPCVFNRVGTCFQSMHGKNSRGRVLDSPVSWSAEI